MVTLPVVRPGDLITEVYRPSARRVIRHGDAPFGDDRFQDGDVIHRPDGYVAYRSGVGFSVPISPDQVRAMGVQL